METNKSSFPKIAENDSLKQLSTLLKTVFVS